MTLSHNLWVEFPIYLAVYHAHSQMSQVAVSMATFYYFKRDPQYALPAKVPSLLEEEIH